MPEAPLQQLANRLARVHKHLGKWARRSGVSCYRLYEKDISDQPLIVDWYDGDVVCWSMRRTKDETEAQDAAWLAGVREALMAGLGVAGERLWMKRRARQEDRQQGGQYQPLGRDRATREVREGALRLEVNLSDYLDVGLFLDHRPLRLRVGREAAGKDVLNLFCYTGAFSCHAAAGGARSTTSVDLSNTYLDWAGRNLARNGFAGEAHRIVRADCLAWLTDAARAAPAYDLIVCDPPTFSNSTAMEGSFSVDRDHPWLVATCARLLRPGGTLYFSTNSRRFALDAAALAGLAPEEITAGTIDEDFRGRQPHRAWRVSPRT
jgi:23S rRNA G2069 N7-methylase RlmK/C1962 C5-methylase RlmI